MKGSIMYPTAEKQIYDLEKRVKALEREVIELIEITQHLRKV